MIGTSIGFRNLYLNDQSEIYKLETSAMANPKCNIGFEVYSGLMNLVLSCLFRNIQS